MLSPGSALLSPRGDVSEHGAHRFFARLAEGVFDPVEVTRRTHALADFISVATADHSLAADRLLVVGFPDDANIAATLLQLRPEVLAGAILLRPLVVLDQPATADSLAGKRILLATGAQDPIVPANHPPRLATLLEAGGATVWLQYAAAGHNLTPRDLAAAQNFLSDR